MDQILPELEGWIYTLLKQFKFSKLIEVEKYQHFTSIGGSFVAMNVRNLGPIEFLLNLIWLHMD